MGPNSTVTPIWKIAVKTCWWTCYNPMHQQEKRIYYISMKGVIVEYSREVPQSKFHLCKVLLQDNTNQRARRAGGPYFPMRNVNFRRAEQRRKGGPAGCTKRRWSGRLQKRAALQPALMYSPLAHPVVQPASLPFCATCQPVENSCFSLENTALQPAGPPFIVIPFITFFSKKIIKQHGQNNGETQKPIRQKYVHKQA